MTDVCPYKPCGSKEECLGCCNDPEHRDMSLESFVDMCFYHKVCNMCRHYDSKADLPGHESQCKRLDHKHLRFWKPWFKSYDCNGPVCSDFTPAERCLFLYRHWKPEFNLPPEDDEKVALVVDGDREIMWHVRALDFFYGDHINEDGSLCWTDKVYYKQSKSNPIGYVCLQEYPDGRICYYNTDKPYTKNQKKESEHEDSCCC